MVAGAARLDALIRDLRAGSRLTIQEIALKPVSPDKRLAEIARQFGATIAECRASIDIVPGPGCVVGPV
jgi:light-regulated signal transduction histidine kinase (bacteriophytochrome)